ncbi:hypothetical protein RB195_005167 [Necator americanus]
MPFISSLQSAFRKITTSPKKDRRGSLLEPPFLPIPCSPEQRENFYVIDESFTTLSINDGLEMDKTYYENETFTMYTSDASFFRGKNVSKRKRSISDVERSMSSPEAVPPMTKLTALPTRLLQCDNEPNYSPPAKRAPILRRFRTRVATPPYRPPEVPPVSEDDQSQYLNTMFTHDEPSPITSPRKCINFQKSA